jgi:RNA polymerase sigma factor (sigma-70 family)
VKNQNSSPKVVRIDLGGHEERLRARRDALVIAHTDLVRGIAVNVSKRLPPSFDLEDLVSVGMIALLQAAQRYRPEQNNQTPFSAYARLRIAGAMLDSARWQRYRDSTMVCVDDIAPVAVESDIDERIDEQRRLKRLAKVVEMLPPEQREAIQRKFWKSRNIRSTDLEGAIASLRRELKVA